MATHRTTDEVIADIHRRSRKSLARELGWVAWRCLAALLVALTLGVIASSVPLGLGVGILMAILLWPWLWDRE